MYLGELSHEGHTPTAWRFGSDVLESRADVLTFNYDTIAEEAIAHASGIGPKPQPERGRPGLDEGVEDIADEDLDASHLRWKPSLAYGFNFDELSLPIAGVPPYISGARYYSHPNNALYTATRVLKLHGSIDWLKYTPARMIPPEYDHHEGAKPEGIVLERHPHYWMGESPTRNGWYMDPLVIPPQLYKQFSDHPFRQVWDEALHTLSECHTLIVIGYSFPPTDFRTRRLFLEAFSEHPLQQLVVVNPDTSVTQVVRRLIGFTGPVVSCDDLQSLYGLPRSWFDYASGGSGSSTS